MYLWKGLSWPKLWGNWSGSLFCYKGMIIVANKTIEFSKVDFNNVHLFRGKRDQKTAILVQNLEFWILKNSVVQKIKITLFLFVFNLYRGTLKLFAYSILIHIFFLVEKKVFRIIIFWIDIWFEFSLASYIRGPAVKATS